MAIRIRKIGDKTVALCAAQSNAQTGDIYLDDGIHHALSTKFGLDWFSEGFLEEPLADETLIHLMAREMDGKIW